MKLVVHIHCHWAPHQLFRKRAVQTCSMGFPRQLGLRDSHTEDPSDLSDLRLEGSNWEGLDNSPGWFGLYLHLLAEGHSHSRLGGWLHSGLDPAKPWNGEDSGLLHFRGGKCRQAFKKA